MVINATNEPSPLRKTRREVLSQWRHTETLEAARRIFARQGYSATNVEDIAREAGMAKGTLYLYFKSKEEVFVAVLASDLEGLIDKTIEGMAAVKTFDEQLSVFLNLRAAYVQHNRDFLSIYFAEFGSRSSRSPLISDVIDKLFRRGFDFMRQCLEQAIAQGELRPIPVEPAAFAIFDIARGFAERHLHGQANQTLEEDVAFTHSMILKGLQSQS